MDQLVNLHFKKQNDLYVSDHIRLIAESCAVQVALATPGTVTVETSITGDLFFPAKDISIAASPAIEFNLSGCKPGQFLRVITTSLPVNINILI